ncbi:NAD-dependent epimerase/dehydratase family protein [Nocardia sp. NPDC055002]
MKVAVVGATGYLGRSVVESLRSDGCEVISLSRHPEADGAYGALEADVTMPNLGLGPSSMDALRGTDAIISCFGSVSMETNPESTVGLHVHGTEHVFDLAARLGTVERVVHVSSVLALGRAEGELGNRELSRDQSFRNWYEYAKYRSELIARNERRVPVNILRLGTLLGPSRPDIIPLSGGPTALLAHVLRGLPLALVDRGRFPIYASDVAIAARAINMMMKRGEYGITATYFDPELPDLCYVLEQLSRPWGIFPRLVDARVPTWLQRIAARRLGVYEELSEYSRPLMTFGRDILTHLGDLALESRPDYIFETGRVLRDGGVSFETGGLAR